MKLLKGYVLVEMLIAMCITTLIMISVSSILIKVTLSYSEAIKNIYGTFIFEKSCQEVENYCISKKDWDFSIENNEITIKSSETKIISLNNSSSILTVYNSYGIYGKFYDRYLIRNIQEFKTMKKENLIYIFIKDKEGRKWERIISVKKVT
ncbi:hypothetical protein [Clostridium cellulovorans]|nr:hypothetical protein [Clostridium cellulovorans]